MPETTLPLAVVEEVELSELRLPLVLANRDPAPGGTSVSRAAAIILELISPARGLVDVASLRVWVGDILAFDGALSPAVQPAFSGARAGVQVVPGGVRVTLDPRVAFASQASIAVRAASGILDERYAFTVEDVTSPRLLAAEALSSTDVALVFDEPVLVGHASAMFVALDTPAVPLALVSAQSDGSRLHLTVVPPMTPGVRYEVRVSGVTDLRGNGVAPPDDRAVFRGHVPYYPSRRRFDLWSMLPACNRRADITGDLARFIACLQEVTDQLLASIDRMAERWDLERAPEVDVDFLLRDLGNPFELVLNEIEKRRLASVLVEMYRLKGTEKGIRSAARFFLGIEIEAITTFSGAPLALGESLLGDDWELGPSNRFALYAFEVRVPRVLSPEERWRLRTVIEWMKPGHTHLVALMEPAPPPPVIEWWDLGSGELGVTTELA